MGKHKRLAINKLGYILLTGLTLFGFSIPLHAQTNFFEKISPSKSLVNHWEYRWEDSKLNSKNIPDWAFDKPGNRSWNWFKVPGQPPNIRNLKVVWLRVKLPAQEWSAPGLLFMTNDQWFQVYLEGKLIYQFGNFNQELRKSPGSPWHIIPLPKNYQNKLLSFRMKSAFLPVTGLVRTAEIGTRELLLIKIIRENIDYLIVACIFIFLGFGLVVIFAFRSWEQKAFYTVGFASILTGVWLIAETPMRQVVFDLQPKLWGYIAMLAFYLMPSGICAFVEEIFIQTHHKIVRVLWQSYILFAVIALILDLTNIINLADTLSTFYILVGITICILGRVVLDAIHKGDREARIFGVGIIIFALTGVYDILGWFFRVVPWVRFTTHWGLFIFIISLVYILRKHYVGIYNKIRDYSNEIEMKNEALKKMWLEVTQSRDQIAEWNRTLEKRVVERTEQLEKANQDLKDVLQNLHKTQARLIESEKMSALGNLVAGVAHEINTPIGISVTAASHLEQKTTEFLKIYQTNRLKRSDLENFLQTSDEMCKIILVNLERSANLIRSFKQVAVDQSSEVKRTFKVKEYLEEVLLSLKPKLKKTAHEIEIQCPEELEIHSFPGALSQIITNLMMNTLFHAYGPEEAGHITISVIKNDSDLKITYSDDGKGIPTENIKKVFEPFYTTMRGKGGTGLGLHIVYNIVSQTLGGNIECFSEPGDGTTFVMTIPIEGA